MKMHEFQDQLERFMRLAYATGRRSVHEELRKAFPGLDIRIPPSANTEEQLQEPLAELRKFVSKNVVDDGKG